MVQNYINFGTSIIQVLKPVQITSFYCILASKLAVVRDGFSGQAKEKINKGTVVSHYIQKVPNYMNFEFLIMPRNKC